jgi:hypothetical protein
VSAVCDWIRRRVTCVTHEVDVAEVRAAGLSEVLARIGPGSHVRSRASGVLAHVQGLLSPLEKKDSWTL